jgi:cytoskeletal protein RodZ
MNDFELDYFTKISFEATSLGDLFKRAREKRGLALRDIAKKTRIHIGILSKLENNNLANLPSKAYVRGFVKTIAKTLNVDSKISIELLEEGYDHLIFENIDLVMLPPCQEVHIKKQIPYFDKNAVRKIFAMALLIVFTIYGAINLTSSAINQYHFKKTQALRATPSKNTAVKFESYKELTTSLDFPKRLETRNAAGELIPKYDF